MKLVCTLPNASGCISGVRFEKQDGMMVSVKDVDDIPKAVLDAMLSIDGYALQATPEEVDLTDAEKAGLEAEAEGETPAPESHQETVKLQTKRSASKAKTTKSGA